MCERANVVLLQPHVMLMATQTSADTLRFFVMPAAAASGLKSDLPEKWHQILSDLITDPKKLLRILELDQHAQSRALASASRVIPSR